MPVFYEKSNLIKENKKSAVFQKMFIFAAPKKQGNNLMNKKKLREIVCGQVVCMLSALLLPSVEAPAQVMPGHEPAQENREAGKPFISRWTFSTNVLEWCMTVPNIGFEFALSSSDYNRAVIGLTAKYNWNTYSRHVPAVVFDMLDIRPEYRYYFRTLGQNSTRKNSKLRSVKYLGAYADYAQYAFKLRKGIQGQAVGLGVSYGYAFPMYEFRKGALDLDLGISVGVQVTGYYGFRRDVENNCYVKVASGSRDWHFTPFPVVSELRVALAWRQESVRHKYIKEDPMLRQVRLAEADAEMAFADIRTSFDGGLSPELRESYCSDAAAYRDGFVAYVAETAGTTAGNVRGYDLSRSAYASVLRKIRNLERKAIREFDRSMKANAKK